MSKWIVIFAMKLFLTLLDSLLAKGAHTVGASAVIKS